MCTSTTIKVDKNVNCSNDSFIFWFLQSVIVRFNYCNVLCIGNVLNVNVIIIFAAKSLQYSGSAEFERTTVNSCAAELKQRVRQLSEDNSNLILVWFIVFLRESVHVGKMELPRLFVLSLALIVTIVIQTNGELEEYFKWKQITFSGFEDGE